MSDADEPIDPLDPRFVEAVLARARRRAKSGQPAPPPAPSVPPPAPVPPPAEATVEPLRPEPIADPISAGATKETAPLSATALDGGPAPLLEDDDEGHDDSSRRTRNAIEWIAVAVGAVVVAFLIRAFLLQAFYIPSESMEPTLEKNDRILVNKLSYKLHDINRGDLVVFKKPPNERATDINDLIKRVVALPGETIELHNDGTITVDDRLLTEPYLRTGQPPGTLTMTRELFVDGACTNPVTETSSCTVGDDFVFVMGDNRNHSHDSRAFGPIDQDLVVGRAFVKVWPLSEVGFL